MRTKYIAIILVLATILVPGATHAQSFTDINPTQFYSHEIEVFRTLNLSQGYPDGTFRPDNSLTRAEAAVFFERALSLPPATGTTHFSDVDKTSFAYDAIQRARSATIIEGFPNGTFQPNESLTRGQMAIMLARAYSLEATDAAFIDVPSNHYAKGAIDQLAGSLITNGYPDGTFRPNTTVTRGEFAVMLIRAIIFDTAGEERIARTAQELRATIPTLTGDWAERTTIERAQAFYRTHPKLTPYLPDLSLAETTLELQKQTKLAPLTRTLEGDYTSGRWTEKLFSYEARFAANGYRGQGDEDFVFVKGSEDSRILITAPHATSHIREGAPKISEGYTGAIALLLHEYTGAHILYIARESIDPNYYNNIPFKEEMRRIAVDEGIDLVIDLHGAARERDFDLDVGTDGGELINQGEVLSLFDAMARYDISNVGENLLFTAGGSANIANFSKNELGIEAMQLEINRQFREPRVTVDPTYRMFAALATYVTLYK
ncbi:S-layer homology domain-containing protein [Paenalkalicoccus suaedae]|uniref:S-layer homology domain-containing protein n=1 Tax=Paenalkalicoccus suaedae TaxID=2592382 RepID=A0A859FHV7_9BACI|nr:S-layer homology domain-containing protein [Paenalkalicoccus suaedae]QKS72400.1 S-layer homology domain-containing protein [Paenalkalicoccus suaedae]